MRVGEEGTGVFLTFEKYVPAPLPLRRAPHRL